MPGSTSSKVKSAERALALLDLLSRLAEPVSTATIAEQLELPKSSAHHLLNVMHARRFVAYWPDVRRWTLGVAALELGAAYRRTGHLEHAVERHLKDLVERTGHTSHLAVLQGHDAVYLAKREPTNSGIRLVTDVGTRIPAHLTAVGRCLLAALDDDALASLYRDYDWPQRTDTRITSVAALKGVLDDVRASGYAAEVGATTDGIECIAAPVSVGDGTAVAAIGIARVAVTPASGRLIEAVRDAARAASASLAGRADATAP
ncbi:IclR family transcriptional regulator [Mycolicibacterium smegmatis]|uniref:IclR family transcriptional regulator n=1 Tax=Mycolicibacterium smegmatis TaxID=1772 RepID=UPI0020A3C22D|nr:IclR family transcriptional regulator [Mycolicibacterium smegmatis]MCP2621302.1 IclR family transcriptional regulator [Mycolicibacterium smegmatis]MCP2622942.1 IclR family transcriptional regulator [Mycolicibacterium smegmatis]